MTYVNNYPFQTKNAIAARLETDDEYVRECMIVLDGLQTEDEQQVKQTIHRNYRGWSSGDISRGAPRLAEKIGLGIPLSGEELASCRKMTISHRKMLAAEFRRRALAENPALAAAAAAFFQNQ